MIPAWLQASWKWIAGGLLAVLGAVGLKLKMRSEREEGRAEGVAAGKAEAGKTALEQADLHRRINGAHIDAGALAEMQAASLRARQDMRHVKSPEALLGELEEFEKK